MMHSLGGFFRQKNIYSFHNTYSIDAPVSRVWDELINYQKWPSWCRNLEAIEPCGEFHGFEIGNTVRSTWKGLLPYRLTFESIVADFIPCSFLSFNVSGDLQGKGICYFHGDADTTLVSFLWNVSPTKLWIKMSSPFARSVYIENHDYIMDQVFSSFVKMVSVKTYS